MIQAIPEMIEMADTAIIVIEGGHTSRTTKGGKVFEYTNWYEENGTGGLKSVGKEEPDYKKYYPPAPKAGYSFPYKEYGRHVLLAEKDYNANQAVFRTCLAFPLDGCQNRIHPLYKNPQKEVNSVQDREVSSARSLEPAQKKGEEEI
jgi:hypothetical protein